MPCRALANRAEPRPLNHLPLPVQVRIDEDLQPFQLA